jgi:hypothetical protein
MIKVLFAAAIRRRPRDLIKEILGIRYGAGRFELGL